jgi:hypothetical protein
MAILSTWQPSDTTWQTKGTDDEVANSCIRDATNKQVSQARKQAALQAALKKSSTRESWASWPLQSVPAVRGIWHAEARAMHMRRTSSHSLGTVTSEPCPANRSLSFSALCCFSSSSLSMRNCAAAGQGEGGGVGGWGPQAACRRNALAQNGNELRPKQLCIKQSQQHCGLFWKGYSAGHSLVARRLPLSHAPGLPLI